MFTGPLRNPPNPILRTSDISHTFLRLLKLLDIQMIPEEPAISVRPLAGRIGLRLPIPDVRGGRLRDPQGAQTYDYYVHYSLSDACVL